MRLASGKKIQVPFEQLIIFATNLEPRDLVDEAFLRRIPYKIEISDPSEEEFHRLFAFYGKQLGCEHRPEMVQYLLEKHYRPCQPCPTPLPSAGPAQTHPQQLQLSTGDL